MPKSGGAPQAPPGRIDEESRASAFSGGWTREQPVYRQARKVALWHRLQAHRLQRRDRTSNRRRCARASRSSGRNGAAAGRVYRVSADFRSCSPVHARLDQVPRRSAILPTRPLTAPRCTTSFRSAARPNPPSPHKRQGASSRSSACNSPISSTTSVPAQLTCTAGRSAPRARYSSTRAEGKPGTGSSEQMASGSPVNLRGTE